MKKTWEEEKEKTSKIRDSLGKKIDREIFDTVVALKCLGFIPMASCGGHIKWGVEAPWVDIGVKESIKLWKEHDKEKDNDKKTRIRQKSELINLKDSKRLLKLLEEFYRNRNVPFLVRLHIDYWGVYYRLESTGAELQQVEKNKDKIKFLKEYQKEMKEFTKFLKSKIK